MSGDVRAVGQDPDRQARASEYARIRRRLFVARLLFGLAYILIWLATDLTIGLRRVLEARFDQPAVVVGLYFAAFLTAFTLASLPLAWYSGFHLPHKYGLSVQSLGSWAADQIKGFGLEFGFGLIAVQVLYWLLRTDPVTWWLWAGIGTLAFTVVLANLLPVVIIPLFYRLRPVDDRELTERIGRLAERAGAQIRGVYCIDLSAKTTATNAALVGLGNTRRVILGDNLLDQYTPSEIEVIMAHELGHHVHRDIPKLIVVQSLVTLVGLFAASLALEWTVARLGMAGLADVANLPVVVLVLSAVALLAMPMVNGFSRHVERQADQYALEMTRDPAGLESAMRKLTDQNLSEAAPHPAVEFLLYDHPATAKRIAHARSFATQHGLTT
jgi:STE24 endopeptidase